MIAMCNRKEEVSQTPNIPDIPILLRDKPFLSILTPFQNSLLQNRHILKRVYYTLLNTIFPTKFRLSLKMV